jgi:hypothetical protein
MIIEQQEGRNKKGEEQEGRIKRGAAVGENNR